MNLAFIGLGNMGSAMVRNLLGAGHAVAVWDRTRSKCEEVAKNGARVASSAADAARGAEAALSSLANDEAVSSVVLGTADGMDSEALVRGMAPSAVHLSLSTISPALSRQLEEAHRAAGQRYVAAPVLGRPEAAERGELVVLAAGASDAIDACAPILDVLGKKTYRLGAHVDRANATKLSANLVMASLLEVFGEAFALAESHGVAAMQVLDILKDSMLSPTALGAYGERIARSRFEPAGFRLALGLKDVDLALQAAEGAALPLPFASALRDRFLVAIATGLADKDWAAVARTLPHKSMAP